MLNLKQRYPSPDIKRYVFDLEEWIIQTLKHVNVLGERRKGRIGIWVNTPSGEAKIAALGIRIRKWVSYHGIAINISPDLEHFQGIVPCGIREYGVTSLKQLGINATMAEVDNALTLTFPKIFKNHFAP